jgi:hypothetical protein
MIKCVDKKRQNLVEVFLKVFLWVFNKFTDGFFEFLEGFLGFFEDFFKFSAEFFCDDDNDYHTHGSY